jgi:hypothetical protein
VNSDQLFEKCRHRMRFWSMVPARIRQVADNLERSPWILEMLEVGPTLLADGLQETMLGDPRTGKSLAGWFLACMAEELGPGFEISIRVSELVQLAVPKPEQFNRIMQSRGLVQLDDLGAQARKVSGWDQEKLEDVIDWRYQHMLPTLITSNLNEAELRAEYGERIYTRLQQWGYFFEPEKAEVKVYDDRPRLRTIEEITAAAEVMPREVASPEAVDQYKTQIQQHMNLVTFVNNKRRLFAAQLQNQIDQRIAQAPAPWAQPVAATAAETGDTQ